MYEFGPKVIFEVGAKSVRLRNDESTSHLRIPTLNRSLRAFLRRFLFRSEVGTASDQRIEFGPKVIFEFAATPQRLRPEGGIRLRSDVDPTSDQNFKTNPDKSPVNPNFTENRSLTLNRRR